MDGKTNATAESTSGISIELLRQLASDPSQTRLQLIPLLNELRTDDDEVKGWVNDCLQLVQELPSSLASELSTYCNEANVAVASWACKLLGRMGHAGSAWQDVLVHALTNHESTAVKQAAAAALTNIPGLSAATVQALRLATHSNDARLKRLAEQAMASTID